jgi:hypothetical protein
MTDLRRAGRALVDDPPAPVTPIDELRLRVDHLRRRRRQRRSGIITVAVVLVAALVAGVFGLRDRSGHERVATTSPPPTSAPTSSSASTTGPTFGYEVDAAGWFPAGSLGLASVYFDHPPGSVLSLTTDGQHWTRINPPTSVGLVADVFAASTTDLWALEGSCATVRGDETLQRSRDAGRTWTALTTDSAPSCSVGSTSRLDFLNANTGWLVTVVPTGPAAFLQVTDDGGSTWTPWASRVRLPSLGDVRFVTATDGYLGAGPDSSASRGLYVTHDGGRTWTPVTVALPPDRISGWTATYATPTFSDTNDGVLPVTLVSSSSEEVAWYATTDGGRTWQSSGSPLSNGNPPTGVPWPGPALTGVLNASTWWVVAQHGTTIVTKTTVDGGQTWLTATSAAPATGSNHRGVEAIAIGPKTAWLRTGTDLWLTTDAGLHWKAIEPA